MRVLVSERFSRMQLWLMLLAVALSLGGCYSYKGKKYTPSLELATATVTIPAKVQIVAFRDASPPADKESGLMQWTGSSAVSPETLNGKLEDLIRTSIKEQFTKARVFEALEDNIQSPTFLMSGTIHRFYERAAELWISACCGVIGIFLGLPVITEEGEVDIEIVLSSPKGEVIKAYRNRSDCSKWLNLYNSRFGLTEPYTHGYYLNKAFDEVANRLKEQMLQDRSFLLAP